MLDILFIVLCYIGCMILIMVEQHLLEAFRQWRVKRRQQIFDSDSNWDWLIELEDQPIEVTFDHETFLVFDRETELWHLEHREPEPSDDLIDLLLGDDVILIEATAMYNGYVRRQIGGFGIKSPSDF